MFFQQAPETALHAASSTIIEEIPSPRGSFHPLTSAAAAQAS
jgi:hypothetical protein